jgi:ABC-type multidrug transport system ATPase subunit
VDLSRNEKISILITTHYVEEARKAQVVALMRKGRLLVEQTPKVLMTHFGVNSLEDVFIKVCMVTEGTQASQLPKSFFETIEQKKSQQKGPTPTKLPQKSQMELKLEPTFCKRFQTLSWKNALRLWRQPL